MARRTEDRNDGTASAVTDTRAAATENENESRDGSEGGDGNEDAPVPVLRRAEAVSYDPVGAAEGLSRGVLIGDADGAPNFALRRFTLDPGASVPKHTNEVEHEQYVLSGEYVVGIGEASPVSQTDDEVSDRDEDGNEHVVTAGDSLLIPAGVVHWYRNDSDEAGAFLCAVPNGDDEIRLADSEANS